MATVQEQGECRCVLNPLHHGKPRIEGMNEGQDYDYVRLTGRLKEESRQSVYYRVLFEGRACADPGLREVDDYAVFSRGEFGRFFEVLRVY